MLFGNWQRHMQGQGRTGCSSCIHVKPKDKNAVFCAETKGLGFKVQWSGLKNLEGEGAKVKEKLVGKPRLLAPLPLSVFSIALNVLLPLSRSIQHRL
eukprot:2015797-Rhodomonas_salina.2